LRPTSGRDAERDGEQQQKCRDGAAPGARSPRRNSGGDRSQGWPPSRDGPPERPFYPQAPAPPAEVQR
jgi:hypothetical protein